MQLQKSVKDNQLRRSENLEDKAALDLLYLYRSRFLFWASRENLTESADAYLEYIKKAVSVEKIDEMLVDYLQFTRVKFPRPTKSENL